MSASSTEQQTVPDDGAVEDQPQITREQERDALLAATPAEDDVETPAADDEGDGRPGRDAARYRKRLRETEAERDDIRGRLEAVQRSEAERLASGSLRVPGGLWAGGVQLGDLLDDRGLVDPVKVEAAATAAADAIGLDRNVSRPPRPDYSQGRGNAGEALDPFRDAFKPPRN